MKRIVLVGLMLIVLLLSACAAADEGDDLEPPDATPDLELTVTLEDEDVVDTPEVTETETVVVTDETTTATTEVVEEEETETPELDETETPEIDLTATAAETDGMNETPEATETVEGIDDDDVTGTVEAGTPTTDDTPTTDETPTTEAATDDTDATAMTEEAVPVSMLNTYGLQSEAGQELGEVQDLVLDPETGRIAYMLVSVTDAAGAEDERLVPIPWDQVELDSQQGAFVLMADQTALDEAPGYREFPPVTPSDWESEVRDFWETQMQ